MGVDVCEHISEISRAFFLVAIGRDYAARVGAKPDRTCGGAAGQKNSLIAIALGGQTRSAYAHPDGHRREQRVAHRNDVHSPTHLRLGFGQLKPEPAGSRAQMRVRFASAR